MADLDLLVLGSGVAGLSAAVRAATSGLRVGVLTKGELEQSATRWAQGGVAAVLADDEDSTDLHLADTLQAGAGLCDVDAVRVLVDEGPTRVTELIALGAVFDRDADGTLQLAREGGHSRARVVHAGGAATGHGDRTGARRSHADDRGVGDGALARRRPDHRSTDAAAASSPANPTASASRSAPRTRCWRPAAPASCSPSPPTPSRPPATASPWRCAPASRWPTSSSCSSIPTALHHPAMPRPLLSEALRGHGAMLRDKDGKQFVDELSPRDVVSRAMSATMGEQGVDHLWLDATGLETLRRALPDDRRRRSPPSDSTPRRDWLPIAPAAHYLSGGVVTDLDGRASVEGLWAAGEAACVGVHGANRLASNSLLDGMVFAARVIEAIEDDRVTPEATGAMRAVLEGGRRHPRPTHRPSRDGAALSRPPRSVPTRSATRCSGR